MFIFLKIFLLWKIQFDDLNPSFFPKFKEKDSA